MDIFISLHHTHTIYSWIFILYRDFILSYTTHHTCIIYNVRQTISIHFHYFLYCVVLSADWQDNCIHLFWRNRKLPSMDQMKGLNAIFFFRGLRKQMVNEWMVYDIGSVGSTQEKACMKIEQHFVVERESNSHITQSESVTYPAYHSISLRLAHDRHIRIYRMYIYINNISAGAKTIVNVWYVGFWLARRSLNRWLNGNQKITYSIIIYVPS